MNLIENRKKGYPANRLKTRRAIAICILFFFIFSFLPAQQNKIDSLQNFLKNAGEDTVKAMALNELARQFISSEPQKAFDYAQQALKLSEKLKWKYGIGYSSHNIGYFYYIQADYPNTLAYWTKAMDIRKELNDKAGTARSLGNIGLVYWNQANYPKALEYYFNALKIAEESGDKNGIADNTGNIGLVYMEQGDNAKALDYFLKALKFSEEIDDKSSIAVWFGNIGLIYSNMGDYSKALEYYFKRLKLDEETGNKNNLSINLVNIGSVYNEQADRIAGNADSLKEFTLLLSKALDHYFRGLKISEELGNKNGIAVNYGNIGFTLVKMKKYSEAEEYLQKAIALCRSLQMPNELMQFEKAYSDLDSSRGNYKGALEHYKNHILLRDSIASDENTRNQTRTEMNYEFEKKEAATQAQHEKQLAVAEAEKKRQRLFLIFAAAAAIAVAAIAFIIFRSLRITKRQKAVIENQKLIVDEKNRHIEEKNKEITDSINYARRIQRALLASDNLLRKHLPEYFVLFKPKDIVSGDFYWARYTENKFYLAVADCTGHGVPGAFMSLLNISLLKEAVVEKKISSPDMILNEVRSEIITALNPDGKEEGKDGMDCVLCSFDFTSPHEVNLNFSCANNPLWLIRNSELKEFKADKMPVGKFIDSSPFTLHSVTLRKGDTIYACSDGYPDQFGGPKGKKFKYSNLEKLLLTLQDKSMDEQKRILLNTIDTWRGDLEQIDDICIIGIRI